VNIYVGNLPYAVSEGDLRSLFEQFGAVTSATIIKDKFTGDSKGFGFIEMSDTDAQAAIDNLNGTEFKGRSLTVNQARPKSDGPGGGGGGPRRGGPGGGGHGGGGRRF
jgi:RNA recognition motif-containing protein